MTNQTPPDVFHRHFRQVLPCLPRSQPEDFADRHHEASGHTLFAKTKNILLICALTLSAAVLLFFGCKKGVELYNAKNADELFAAGDYAGAREWYEKNGSAEDIARCDFLNFNISCSSFSYW